MTWIKSLNKEDRLANIVEESRAGYNSQDERNGNADKENDMEKETPVPDRH